MASCPVKSEHLAARKMETFEIIKNKHFEFKKVIHGKAFARLKLDI